MYYFASDMHLGLEHGTPSRERERRVVRWLDEVARDAKAIFLVGDVFDFWFEWRKVIPKGFTRLLGKLSELTDRGVEVHFFNGNHDMWAYDYLRAECGVEVHHGPEIFELYGKRVFVAHGDNLYLRQPLGIKVMYFFFRSRFWRRVFSALFPKSAAMRFGQWWSAKSRKSKSLTHCFGGEEEYLIKYTREYSRAQGDETQIDFFVFGHLHCAEDYDMGDGRRAVFLGEWISDAPVYAVLRPDGEMELVAT
ncbi:MAG: UDP-2,3-diacylglucosamine diphosphatase [Rikenellaceae bacterium]|nr:UDP-2,3-diacylglucosamine diphosphatase [Rikenellaceae bacterium]MCL2692987.1 UDP-2,3-diacylglucosamine diphosphatase [Rikenellaceae bacterium]